MSRLTERLPVIPLPAWLSRHSWPIGIQDVVRAILAALSLTGEGHGCYELPGPERVSHSELMARTGLALGHARSMIEVPFVSPGMAARCVSTLTGVEHRLVRELLQSIRVDLDPSGSSFWQRIGDAPQPLDRVIRDAVGPRISLRGRLLERLSLSAAA
ncbi:MAG: Rossmann-fold NAD(P)-binding domain-containing protein [Planctomycetota bacterium]